MNLRQTITGMLMTLALVNTDPLSAASIESLVMPGDVIEGHADVESECSSCHLVFERANQRALCIDCHEDVGDDIEKSAGFHGLFVNAKEDACSSCHTDHEGRDAQIVELDEETFDHEFTDLPLLGKHDEAACADCHEPDQKFRDAPFECFSCHEDDNVHEDFLGTECGDCHSATGWLDVEFDHDTTDYPLIGKHLETACGDCHEEQTFQNAPTTCFGCHESDDEHNGRSGEECENCHNPSSWTDTSFDHERDTSFVLDGSHNELSCGDCHSEDPFADELESTCISCHKEDDEHDTHFGEQCETCHSSEKWDRILFDHDKDTDYTLNGAHQTIACADCHIEPIYDVALKDDCNSCHADDDPHEGEEGVECQDCHNETSWEDEIFFDHDLTRFPLLGEHAEPECDSCHETQAFRDAPEICADCHLEDDPHDGHFYADCAACHNPVDWVDWFFDHEVQTDFPLTGAHAEVSCDDCHRQTLSVLNRLGGRCGDCHRADDIHDGEFGFDCGRCHYANSFREVRSIQ